MDTKKSEKQRLKAIVTGRVQGVGFRWFAEDVANSLEIKGYVRNLHDGYSVEVVAEGEKEKLEELIQELKRGPSGAKVDKIDVEWSNCLNEFNRFIIQLC